MTPVEGGDSVDTMLETLKNIGIFTLYLIGAALMMAGITIAIWLYGAVIALGAILLGPIQFIFGDFILGVILFFYVIFMLCWPFLLFSNVGEDSKGEHPASWI